MATTSPNMGLTVPTPQATGAGDIGPAYAQNISNDLNTVDAHDHSSGKGVQVTPAGININQDLSLNGFNLNQVRAVRYTSQATFIEGSGDTNADYVISGNRYFVDGQGNQIQLTNNGVLNIGLPNVQSYISVGVSTPTGPFAIASALSSSAIAGLVPWNVQRAQAGVITQPVTSGTGSAWINFNSAGLYQITYSLIPSQASGGCVAAPGTNAFAFQTINATGVIGQGTLINQSFAPVWQTDVRSISTPTAMLPITRSYFVQLGSGVNVETWMQGSASGAAVQALAIQPTGSSFSAYRIG